MKRVERLGLGIPRRFSLTYPHAKTLLASYILDTLPAIFMIIH